MVQGRAIKSFCEDRSTTPPSPSPLRHANSWQGLGFKTSYSKWRQKEVLELPSLLLWPPLSPVLSRQSSNLFLSFSLNYQTIPRAKKENTHPG